nr:hypothetical protein HAGR004_19520 [Bdellovibrio sp. HAGR004]
MTNSSIYVGYTLADKSPIYLSNKMRTGHVQVIGATGRGKTASVVLPWFTRDLRSNNTPILLDGKGDEEILLKLKENLSTLEFSKIAVFNLSDHVMSLNPLIGGSATEVADRLISSLEFESEYFKSIQHSVVLLIIQTLKACGYEASIPVLCDYLSYPHKILELVKDERSFPQDLMFDVTKLCQMNKDTREERLSGIISQLKPFCDSELREQFFSHDKANEIDLEKLINAPESSQYKACVILLNTLQFQKTAKVFGKMVLQLLAWITSKRKAGSNFCPVMIDEFSAFVFDGFEQFLNKARSKNIALHLSHQSLGDLENVSASFAKTINVNTNIKILLGLNDPDTADYLARHIGTRTRQKSTERATKSTWGDVETSGEMSLREVEQYKIHPNRLKNYSNGVGVISLLVDGYPLVEEVQFDRRA